MKPFLVVDLVEEGADFAPRLGEIPVFVAVNLLMFQRFHEGFARRVIPRIAFARHADLDTVFFKQAGVIAAGVLRAAIRMMHQTRFYTRRDKAMRRALSVSCSSSVRSSAQPITRRE